MNEKMGGIMSITLFRKNTRPSFSRESFLAPFNNLENLMEEMWRGSLDEKNGSWDFAPKITFHEDDKFYSLGVELPGVKKEDIHLSFKDDQLIITGERKSEKKTKEGRTSYEEFTYGTFSRMLTVPKDVDKEKVSAELKDGVLEVTLAKNEKASVEQRKITIK